MKTLENKLPVEVSEGMIGKKFTIHTTRKAFNILSSTLYSAKIQAVVRELSTNAADAHVAANKKSIPFKIHLPNCYEPYFSVKDEGTGLSENDIYKLYTTYFASDKTESNDFTGCLGLGSKSPFAYTSSFSVTSIINKEKTNYTCYVDTDGIPIVTKMESLKTSEPNGLEVKIPVLSDDYSEFEEETSNVLAYFSPLPIVTGMAGFKFNSPEYEYVNEKYGILSYIYNNTSRLIMGNVNYIINRQLINTFSSIDQTILSYGVNIFVPIGSVEPTPNREALSIDKNTISIIKNTLDLIVNETKQRIISDLDAATSLWEARKILYSTAHPIYKKIIEASQTSLLWKGKNIISYFNITQVFKDKNLTGKVELLIDDHNKYSKSTVSYIHPDKNPIFICDLNKGNYKTVHEYIKSKDQKKAYLIHLCAGLYDILKEEGIKEYTLISTLPKPKKESYAKKEYAKFNEWQSTYSYRNKAVNFWKPVDVDLTKGGVYVIISHYNFKFAAEENYPPANIGTYLSCIVPFVGDTKIYGIRQSSLGSLPNRKNWKTLHAYMKEIYENNKDEYEEKVFLMNKSNHFSGLNFYDLIKIKYEKDTVFGQFVITAKNISSYKTDKKVVAFNSLKNIISPNTKEQKDILKDVYKRYPLLEFLNSYCDKSKFLNAADAYIKIIDG